MLVVAAWVLALVGTLAAASSWGGEFRQDYLQRGSDSKAAFDVLQERFDARAGATVQVVLHADGA
jgi:putative drug exporter of the RND superfamily